MSLPRLHQIITCTYMAHGSGVGAHGSGVGAHGSGVGAHGSGVGAHGSGVGAHGSGVGADGSGVGADRSGVGAHGSGVGAHGSGVGADRSGVGAPCQSPTFSSLCLVAALVHCVQDSVFRRIRTQVKLKLSQFDWLLNLSSRSPANKNP